MQSSVDKTKIENIYRYDHVSPQTILGRCASGLAVLAIIAMAGSLARVDANELADRAQSEQARVAVSHAATEHERAVFRGRQLRHHQRLLASAAHNLSMEAATQQH